MSSLSSRVTDSNNNNSNDDDEVNEIVDSIMSSKLSTKSEFRAKLAQMKLWKPAISPSNRDRLELYALRKQAISGSAPTTESGGDDSSRSASNSSSLADRAKRKAWMNKSGMTQEQAMIAYIIEADRQMQLYGTSTPTRSTSSSNYNKTTTALSTTTADDATTTSSSIFFTPRGLGAIPLLCAAASESRQSYLTRLSSTSSNNTKLWWHRQDPLCADPGTFLAIPETFTIWLGTQIESISTNTSLKIWHSYLWPIHNVTLVLWIAIIIVSSLLTTSYLILQTIFYSTWQPTTTAAATAMQSSTGNARVKSLSHRLEQILQEEVLPCQRACLSLVYSHQPISVRCLGLICIPAVKLCQYATQYNYHVIVQAVIFVLLSFLSSWYWTFCMLWIASASLFFAFSIGWCFAVIQLAQDLTPL